MELILTHAHADFDAFASMLLAGKLFPKALPVLPSTMVYKLREVLSLYRDLANFQSIRYLKKLGDIAVDQVIIVDTKKRGKLQEFEPYLKTAGRKIRIFDHHPSTSDDITKGILEHYPYGANTTGLFLTLTEQGLTLTPHDATIALLGIYADTGNLTYPGTTREDALVTSHLLGLGADLQTVNHYLRPYFDPNQRSLFREILASHQEIEMEGYKVVMVQHELDKMIQGLSVLLSNLSDMLGADAIIGVFSAREKPGVQIIIQSLVPEINAGELSSLFNGGGHPGAGAAFVPEGDPDEVTRTLLDRLTEVPLPCSKVRDFMTMDVVTTSPELTLEQAAKHLVQNGIHGAPVVNGSGELVGVISLRDVEKARLQKLLHVPVTGVMSRKVATIHPDAPLITAKKIISSRDIGRLPVVENNQLVGIISRADILRTVNGNGASKFLEQVGY